MAHRRHILPSSYPSHQASQDEISGIPRTREPFSETAGNALTAIDLYHDNKALQPGVDRPIYSMPTLPSQPRQPIGSTLDLRRQSTRRRRHLRCSRNPIVDSPQYQAYRSRQNREGNAEDSKWPEMLENAFLDGTYCSSRHLCSTLTNSQPWAIFQRWEGGNSRTEGSLTVGMN
jgi:transcriptional enhancer factor